MPPLSFGTDTGKNVLAADFLDEVNVELPVLGDHAKITLAQAWHEDELAPYLADTDVMILFHDIARISDATFARAPRLKAVVRAGVGYNNVDIDAAGKRGIVTCNVPDYGSEEVADHAIMFLLALARQLGPCDRSIREGKWDYKVADAAPRLRADPAVGRRIGGPPPAGRRDHLRRLGDLGRRRRGALRDRQGARCAGPDRRGDRDRRSAGDRGGDGRAGP